MLTSLSRLATLTFLLFLGIPFALLALLTTTLALTILFLRLLHLYLDLLLALLHSSISTPTTPTATPKPRSRKRPVRKSPIATPVMRDYEGVGGWRIEAGPDEEAIWMGLNRNLELPASPRVLRRGIVGSRSQSRVQSPELVRGNASPEGYFGIAG